jgi:hypothetical protein
MNVSRIVARKERRALQVPRLKPSGPCVRDVSIYGASPMLFSKARLTVAEIPGSAEDIAGETLHLPDGGTGAFAGDVLGVERHESLFRDAGGEVSGLCKSVARIGSLAVLVHDGKPVLIV